MTSLSGLVRSPFSKIRTNFPCIAKFLQFDMIHKSVGNSNEIHWILMHFVFFIYMHSFTFTVIIILYISERTEFIVKKVPFIFISCFYFIFIKWIPMSVKKRSSQSLQFWLHEFQIMILFDDNSRVFLQSQLWIVINYVKILSNNISNENS